MTMAGMTVKARLVAALGVLALLVLVVSAAALRAVGNEHAEFAEFVREDSERIRLANDIIDAANARAIGARNLLLAGDKAERDGEKAAVDAAQDKLQKRLLELKASIAGARNVTDRERQLVAEFEAVEHRYGPLARAIVDLVMREQHEEAVTRMNGECKPLLAALIKAAGAYVDHSTRHGLKQVENAEAAYALNRIVLLAACGLAFVAAVVLALVLTRGITRALGAEPSELGAAAQRVAAGDLSPVHGAAQAPQGSVLASLGDMQASLARVVGQVRVAADSIATGSTQIAMGNADLSQRTEKQASNLQQTAASMEQMNSTVRNSADTARQATQLAGSASAVAARGGEIVGQVVSTMEDIAASSRRIADIIGVIDGIAFQTNILALNAAVEAARAGEQGRGFAVVAGEVRTLAQRSAEAAREIKSLIGASVGKVEAGSRLVGDAGSTMTDIVAQVHRVADLIGEISNAALEQTTGIGQVNDAVNELDQVTQQNAALVEESAAASESLKQQATRMIDVVSVFKLDAGERPASLAPALKPSAPAPGIDRQSST